MTTANLIQSTSAPFTPWGLREVGWREGSSPSGGFETFAIASTDPNPVFTGDPVITSHSTGGAGGAFQPYVTATSTQTGQGTAQIKGIFVGCEYYNSAVGRKVWSAYWPGGPQQTDATAYVITDPTRRFYAQCSSAVQITSTMINANIGYLGAVSSQGNTLTGQSVLALASSAIALGSSLPFRIIDFWANQLGGLGPGNMGNPPVSAANFFQNGTDFASVGAALVVQFNAIDYNVLTAV